MSTACHETPTAPSPDEPLPAKVGPLQWTVLQPDGPRTVRSIWGTSSANVYAVGDEGTLFHYNGAGWTRQRGEMPAVFRGVWGSAPDNIFVVGHVRPTVTPRPSGRAEGLVYHFDGTNWTAVDVGVQPALYAIWGSSASDVFVAGAEGAVLHFDGHTWTPQPTGFSFSTIRALWGAAPDTVFAVGNLGAVLRYNGTSWSQDSALAGGYLSLWGASAHDIWAVGDVVMHFDGVSWSRQANDIFVPWNAVWGTSATNVYAVGNGIYQGQLFRYDGLSWTLFADTLSHPAFHNAMTTVWGNAGNLWVALGSGAIARYDGSRWLWDINPITLYDVWADTTTGNAFAVGDGGTVLQITDAGVSPLSSGTASPLLAVWGFASNNVYAASPGDRLHYDGQSWTVTPDPPGSDHVTLWGNAPDNLFAADALGRVRRFDGISWSQSRAAGMYEYWFDMWGVSATNILAVGYQSLLRDQGGITRFDGSTWKTEAAGIDATLISVWGARADSVFALAYDQAGHTMGRFYDGSKWSALTLPTTNSPYRVRGTSSHDVYVVGAGGTALLYDGSSWSAQSTGTTADIYGVWVSRNGGLAVGDRGVILRGTR